MHRDINQGISDQQDYHFRHALRRIGLAAAALVGLVAVKPAAAEPRSLLPPSLPPFREVLHGVGQAGPTPAWITFCEQWPDECTVGASQPAALTLGQDIWLILGEINERVNRTILALTDRDHWGVVDRWDYPDDGLGDCEDIQLPKRKLLIQAGLPRRALRMTVVLDGQG